MPKYKPADKCYKYAYVEFVRGSLLDGLRIKFHFRMICGKVLQLRKFPCHQHANSTVIHNVIYDNFRIALLRLISFLILQPPLKTS